MGIRSAMGVKPTQLRNPVPGVDQEAAIASDIMQGSPVSTPPMTKSPAPPPAATPMPEAMPSPTPAPQAVMGDDPFSAPQGEDDPFAPLPAPEQEPFNYDGQEFETKILGSTWKQDKEGNLLVKPPFGKEFMTPNEDQLDGLKLIKDFYVDRGALIGGAAGSAVGTAGGMAVAGPIGAKVLSPILSAAGAGIGAMMSGNEQIDELMKDPEMSKFLWILQKASGSANTAMEPGMAALLAGGSELLGNVVGGVLSQQMTKRADGALVQKEANDLVKTDVEGLMAANKEAGDVLTAADVAAKMPGGEEVAATEAKLVQGGFGTTAATQYNMAIKEKATKIADKLKSIIKSVAPDIDFSKPSQLQIAGKQKIGFDEKNIIDRVTDNYNNLLSLDVQEVKELAMKKRFDINQVVADQSSVLKKLPGVDQFFNEQGQADMTGLGNYVKEYYKGDQAAQEAFNAFNVLTRERNKINSVYVNQKGMSKTPVSGSVDMPESAFQVKDPNASAQFQEALINPDKGYAKNDRAQSDLFGSLPGSIRKELDFTNVEPVGGKLTPGINAPGFSSPANPGGTVATAVEGTQAGLPLKQRYTITPKGAQTRYTGVGPNDSGAADMGVTYDFINKYVDDLQRIAAKSDNPFVKEMAGAARSMEVDVIEEVFAGAGMKDRAAQVARQKADYSGKIDSLRSISKEITSNLDNLGGWALTAPASTLRQLRSVLTKPEYDQFSGAALSQGLKDMLVVNPTQGLNANMIEKNFFKDPARMEAMTELLGETVVGKLQSINKVAKVLESKGLTQAGIDNAVGRAVALTAEAGAAQGAGVRTGVLRGIMDFATRTFGSNAEAQQLLKTKLDDYFALVKPKMTEDQAKAALKFAPNVKKGVVAAGRLTPGSVILNKRSEEKKKFDNLSWFERQMVGSKNARLVK